MATVHDQFVGVADESTYGANVAPAEFFEVVSEDIAGSYERIESEAIRGPVLRADRFAPNPKGAGGSLELEVKDKGLGFWLPHMFGAVATTGDGSTTPFSHTATPGDLAGKSFSLQAARYASGNDSLVPFTYAGGKVAEWELSAEVDGILKANLTLDFASEGIATDALATPTYPAGSQLMTFIGGTVTVGGTSFAVSAISLTGNNGLKVDRYAMRGASSTTKREPKAESLREYGFSLTGEFEDTSHSDRVAATLASGALADIVLHFDSPQGGTFDVTLPAARFDEGAVNIGRQITEQAITGKALQPTAGDAIEAVYTEVL